MNKENQPYILVFGASVVDIFGFCSSCYKPYDSTPGNIKISFGGVCRNIAENMARVGVNTKFISILGDDAKGRSMMEHSKVIGYDMSESLVLENEGTPTYMAILNENGEMVSAVADMTVIDKMDYTFIDSKEEIINGSEYTCLDADDPKKLEYILDKFKGKTKFILDPISAAKAENIKHLIGNFHTVKPNRHEAEILAGFKIESDEDLKKAGDYFLSLGIENVFISLDAEGIYYCNKSECGRIKAHDVEVNNVTGAGDAFVAGLGYGYMNNMSMEKMVKFAIAMSIIAISHEETIHPEMSKELVEKVIINTNWEKIKK
ncbi:MAG: carbohydrate kinase family protein [Tepidibacter sp.]|uniref:carbohydrate kinase family protein n=1 Tax=Tepidibacter sp. TaxID=2529387 RepID=UPI0025F2ADC2|nr:carbohydrate kinase family protein [Tepidibacter sp.]MCT4508304.1 carbohydrate kinase family protein [Tepidibacter sp.]